jgi:hypothetical protein
MTDRTARIPPWLGRMALEFGVVMLGVFAALWADGWMTQRSDRAVEVARLGALRENLDRTLAALREQRDGVDSAARSLRLLAATEGRGAADAELRSLLLDGVFFAPDFVPELNVYADLKSSGELALLTDERVRSGLALMDQRLERTMLLQQDLITVQQLNVDRYSIERIDFLPLIGPELGVPGAEPGRLELDFLREREFRNVVLLKLDLLVQATVHFTRLEETFEQVARAIDDQLGS